MKKGQTLRSEIQRVQNLPPKQYLQGWTEFYKLKFKLTPDVLIPRPETELLVDEALEVARRMEHGETNSATTSTSHPPSPNPLTILDIGTGSGCISISIAKNTPKNVRVIASDISKKALKVAELNAKFHKVENRIFFIESDLLNFINLPGLASTPHPPSSTPSPSRPSPDIIVTNLPYIPNYRLKFIDPMVTEYEPMTALDGGSDGFDLYRKLFAQMKDLHIIPKVFISEIDDSHGEFALLEVKKYFPEAKAEIKKDLTGRDRILIIHF